MKHKVNSLPYIDPHPYEKIFRLPNSKSFERTVSNWMKMVENFPQSKKKSINLFPNKPWFLRVCSISILKTLWEKEKLLLMSNFSFSLSVF